MAGQPVALAPGAAAGDPRYPRFEGARGRAVTIDLDPGDALYLPKLWWHQVEARDAVNLLVNYWWDAFRSEEHTSELQSLMRISYAVFCLKKKTHKQNIK